MKIPLKKLVAFNGNKYIFTRASIAAIDRFPNLEEDPESEKNWKIVPNILEMMLNEKLKININTELKEEKEEKSKKEKKKD